MEQEKKYLKTIEEIKDALAVGKVIYDENTGIEITQRNSGSCYYEDKKRGERFVTAFPIISIFGKHYILEPKPLEVKLWHLYENKNGEKVLILDKFTSENLWGFNFSTKDTAHFASNGTCLNEWDCDLVKEIADLSKYFEK